MKFHLPLVGALAALASITAPATLVDAGYNKIGFVNITRGKLISGIGGVEGGATNCRRSVDRMDCSTSPRRLIGARDFARDPTGRYLYIATTGLDEIGECVDRIYKECIKTVVHDNSSRLIAFDTHNPAAEPVTLSYCGPWVAVEYDAKRGQVVAMRHANLKDDVHGTHRAAEVVAFDAKRTQPAVDAHSKNCFNVVPDNTGQTCACAMGLDVENMNGRVIGRAGILENGILPAATMTLLGDSVLVGDQNKFCVLSFPLDGSAGSTGAGKPVAGTCGKSCGHQGCADIGAKPVPAGKKLGDGFYGNALKYQMFTTPSGDLLLQDMNTETINYTSSPKAQTQFMTAPVAPAGSSIYDVPIFEPASGDLLLRERFSMNAQVLTRLQQGGFGNPKTVMRMTDLQGYYLDKSILNTTTLTPTQGVVLEWSYMPDEKNSGKKKLLALVGLAYRGGSAFMDFVFLEYNLSQ